MNKNILWESWKCDLSFKIDLTSCSTSWNSECRMLVAVSQKIPFFFPINISVKKMKFTVICRCKEYNKFLSKIFQFCKLFSWDGSNNLLHPILKRVSIIIKSHCRPIGSVWHPVGALLHLKEKYAAIKSKLLSSILKSANLLLNWFFNA